MVRLVAETTIVLVQLAGQRFSLRKWWFKLVNKPSHIAGKILLAILAQFFGETSPATVDLAPCLE